MISGGGSKTTKHKWYARAVMTLGIQSHDDAPDPDLYFTKADLVGVVPHNNDPVVIFVVMVGRKVHRALIKGARQTCCFGPHSSTYGYPPTR